MRIMLVDDHAIVRSGLHRLLATLPDTQITEAATGREAIAQLRGAPPDLILLDLNLPGLGGIELLRRLLAELPGVRTIVLSMHAEPLYATRALRAGAQGYVSKNAAPEELLDAIRRVGQGGRYIEQQIAQDMALHEADPRQSQLTERDMEIMRLLSDGQSLASIAAALGVSPKTIANTCTQLKAKLCVNRTADLVRLSLEMGVA
jgi:two-component system, NarL family, invasion response regulator UvrY